MLGKHSLTPRISGDAVGADAQVEAVELGQELETLMNHGVGGSDAGDTAAADHDLFFHGDSLFAERLNGQGTLQ